MKQTFLQELGLSAAPKLWLDSHIHIALALGVLVGGLLWLWMPAGYARPIWADPWMLLSFVLLQPVLEELLFRGVIQGQVLRTPWGVCRWLGISAANAMTSVLFVMLHFMHHAPLWALAVFIPSLVYGHLRERHASLWPALLLHSSYNAIYVIAGV